MVEKRAAQNITACENQGNQREHWVITKNKKTLFFSKNNSG